MGLQADALGKAMQLPESARALNRELNARTYEIIMRNDTKETAVQELKDYYRTTVYYKGLNEQQLNEATQDLYTHHMRQLLLFDPMDYLPKIKCNVLALNGTKDLQVTSDENLAGIAAGLPGKEKLVSIAYPGLNHLFQTAGTGLPDEYGAIETTIEPKVLTDIAKWLNDNTK